MAAKLGAPLSPPTHLGLNIWPLCVDLVAANELRRPEARRAQGRPLYTSSRGEASFLAPLTFAAAATWPLICTARSLSSWRPFSPDYLALNWGQQRDEVATERASQTGSDVGTFQRQRQQQPQVAGANYFLINSLFGAYFRSIVCPWRSNSATRTIGAASLSVHLAWCGKAIGLAPSAGDISGEVCRCSSRQIWPFK